jgi:endoglucanase
VAISYTNDAALTGCDRNLRVDRIDLDNPLRGATLYVDPASNARRQADAWRTTRPGDAALMDRIANRSQADWFGAWSGDVAAAVDRRVSAASAAGAVPILVAYNIPLRDCGSYSAGGAASADAYRSWIAAFARGIGTRRAIVVLEPDALGLTDCLSAADADVRYSLLSSAVTTLSAQPGVAVYLDAGNSHWRSAADMSARLTRAGVARARGFSLNVSNYNTTANELAYGRDVSSRLGGKTFVIDTSRNGLGPTPDFQWCNAPGRALGAAPTTSTGQSGADAFLWIKRPGESDGTCNGGPPAGQWWADYALGLAARAAG